VRLGDLSDNVRIKPFGPLMHLKAYATSCCERVRRISLPAASASRTMTSS
jgi:hypothetical protein